jgi:hypothetical protein
MASSTSTSGRSQPRDPPSEIPSRPDVTATVIVEIPAWSIVPFTSASGTLRCRRMMISAVRPTGMEM